MIAPPEDIVAEFRAIAGQRLERIEGAWEQLIAGAGEPAAKVVFQELHTLKGESTVCGFKDVSLLCNKLEDLLAVARNRGYAVDDDFDLTVSMALRFVSMLSRVQAGKNLGGLDLPGFIGSMDKLLGEVRRRDFTVAQTRTGHAIAPLVAPKAEQLSPAMRKRLAIPAVDAFIEYAVARGHRRNRLRGSWHVMRDELGIHRATLGKDQFHKHVLGAQVVARSLGKQVELEVAVVSTEVTIDVLAAIDASVLHMIRNAIDHGIEPALERERVGKRRLGKVRIASALHGETLELTVEDDGRGVDVSRVLARAKELGLVDDVSHVSPDGWIDFVCVPGFSTRDIASEISGRGIGLDAVRATLVAAGGRLAARTTPGAGTKWTMTLPIPRMEVEGAVLKVPGVPFPIVLDGWVPTRASLTPLPLDVTKILGLSDQGTQGGTPSVFSRGGKEITIATEIPPRTATARRLVATGPEDLYEVVLLESREALLLRAELLV